MEPSKLEFQAWICPYCFDDHSRSSECKESDLKNQIDKLRIKLSISMLSIKKMRLESENTECLLDEIK